MAQPQQVCINCHFFVKYSNNLSGNRTINMGNDERNKIRNGELSRDFGLRCDFGVWDEGFNFEKTKVQEILLKTDRQDFCFYWKYRPNMLIPAAKILQERESVNRETLRERRLTIFGIWIAALALLLDVVLKTLEFISTP